MIIIMIDGIVLLAIIVLKMNKTRILSEVNIMIPDGFEGEQGFIRRMKQLRVSATDSLDIRKAISYMILDGGYPVALDDACDLFIDIFRDGLQLTDALFLLRVKMAS
jgi:hypothetical protein